MTPKGVDLSFSAFGTSARHMRVIDCLPLAVALHAAASLNIEQLATVASSLDA